MIAEDLSLEKLKVDDKLIITVDTTAYEMTVWHIEPKGSAGRRESAGPWIMARIRPGGFGVGFDYTTRMKVEKA